MAIGGYAAAMLATIGMTNLLAADGRGVHRADVGGDPARLPGAAAEGRLLHLLHLYPERGLQVAIFETPGLTGGSNGISGVPPATLFGIDLVTLPLLTLVTVMTAIVAGLITLLVTHRYRAEFSAIQENETLAQSLGRRRLVVPHDRLHCLGGVSGLAGFALVHLLSTAHPSSFASLSAIEYVAYAFVGGNRNHPGPVVGAIAAGDDVEYLQQPGNAVSGAVRPSADERRHGCARRHCRRDPAAPRKARTAPNRAKMIGDKKASELSQAEPPAPDRSAATRTSSRLNS